MAGGVKFVCVFGGSAGGEIALHNADKPSCSAGGSAGGDSPGDSTDQSICPGDRRWSRAGTVPL